MEGIGFVEERDQCFFVNVLDKFDHFSLNGWNDNQRPFLVAEERAPYHCRDSSTLEGRNKIVWVKFGLLATPHLDLSAQFSNLKQGLVSPKNGPPVVHGPMRVVLGKLEPSLAVCIIDKRFFNRNPVIEAKIMSSATSSLS